LVETILEEWSVGYDNLGSITFKREDVDRGFEPDTCFYIQNVGRLVGRRQADLTGGDPPPDLVIEIDITSFSLKRLPLFAAFGIAEVWRFDGNQIEILILESGEYCVNEGSLALPKATAAAISHFVHESFKTGRLEWIKKVRAWAQQQKPAK